jgi:hypothetical protein
VPHVRLRAYVGRKWWGAAQRSLLLNWPNPIEPLIESRRNALMERSPGLAKLKPEQSRQGRLKVSTPRLIIPGDCAFWRRVSTTNLKGQSFGLERTGSRAVVSHPSQKGAGVDCRESEGGNNEHAPVRRCAQVQILWGKRLKRVQHVAGEQSKNSHNQNRFQLFVVRFSAAEMIAPRLLRVVLDSQLFAYRVGCNVLAPVMTEFAVIHPSSGLIREFNLVVPRDPSKVVVKSYPPAGIDGRFGSRPGTGRS